MDEVKICILDHNNIVFSNKKIQTSLLPRLEFNFLIKVDCFKIQLLQNQHSIIATMYLDNISYELNQLQNSIFFYKEKKDSKYQILELR